MLASALLRAGASPLAACAAMLSPRGALSFHSLLQASGAARGAWLTPTAAALAAARCCAPSLGLAVLTAPSGEVPLPELRSALARSCVLLVLPLRLCAGELLSAASVAGLCAALRAEPCCAGLLGGPPGHCVLALALAPAAALGSVQCLDPHAVKPHLSSPRALLQALAAPAPPAVLPLASFASSVSLGLFFTPEAGAAQQQHSLRAFCERFPHALALALPCVSLREAAATAGAGAAAAAAAAAAAGGARAGAATACPAAEEGEEWEDVARWWEQPGAEPSAVPRPAPPPLPSRSWAWALLAWLLSLLRSPA